MRYRHRNRPLFYLLAVAIMVVLTAVGVAGYDRNKAWKSDYSLWYAAFQQAPGRARQQQIWNQHYEYQQ